MPSICEACPIPVKARICCPSKPGTQEVKKFRGKVTKRIIQVCKELNTDGLCGVYGTDRMPEACKEYVCPELYARGLGAHR